MSLAKPRKHYLELARTPISKETFAGEDVRFTPEFEALEDELSKAQSLHDTGRIDWQWVQENSELILRTSSKDLRVASMLAWALYQTQAFPGLVAGICLIQQLCEHHWAEVHPAKFRTRAATINWLITRVDKVLDGNVAVKEQLDLFRQLGTDLECLDGTLIEHLAADAPLLLPLCRRLAGMLKRAAENQPEQGPVETVVAQVKQAATQWLSNTQIIDNEKDAHKALRAQQDNARPLCAWWLRQKATDPRPLGLNRTLLWLAVETIPESNSEGITTLRGLPVDKVTRYQEQFEQGQYADLLLDAEASLASSAFWLDGQRLVWECLQALNADAAKREVEMHFALLLQRLPGIVELRFHDGLPFADAATRSWISAHVMPHLQTSSAPRKELPAGATPVWDEALQNALPILRKEGLKAAVQQLKQGMQNAQGGRARFFWQLNLAQLCYQAKKYELAKTQLETLDQQLQDSGLHAWEPDLALQVLQLLHTCCELLPQSQVVRERKDNIFQRLCYLDLEVALP
ncbi:type VI secretion system protein TssA [Pseudomonas sp. NA-150]|uniref:type VI secretion system protein TssA n=1 Tax=Pseudomonas sp. NA-150 TaxID=3367525 RepID=UPI0037C8B96F